jgi:SGNH hydrolase-like domain, acetyltransferase AlgX
LNGSRLYQLLAEAINTNKTLVKLLVNAGVKGSLSSFDELDPNLAPALRVYPSKLQASFERTKAELLEIRGFLAEQRIRFILALIPSVQSVDDRAFRHSIAYSVFDEKDFELDKPYRLLEEFARRHGIEVVNPYRALKQRHQSGVHLYLRKETHFNPAGHATFARELAAYLNSTVRW